MLIRMQCGSRVGEVVDLTPTEAHAMLADGRASLPDEAAPVMVARREPVVMQKVKQRRTR